MAPCGSGRGGRGGRGGGPSTSGLPLPDGYVPKNPGSGQNKNKGSAPVKASVAKAPETVIPMPWDIDPVIFPKPAPAGSKKTNFNYDREWVSYGVERDQVGERLHKDLLQQKRIQLPAILKGASLDRLREYRKIYKDAGELELFNTRCTHLNEGGLTRLIFQSPVLRPDHPKATSCQQDTPLANILRIPELGGEIIRHLMPSIRDVSALAATCRDVGLSVSQNLEGWDSTKGNFDKDRFEGNKGVRQSVLCIAASRVKQTRTTSPYTDGWRIMENFIRVAVMTSNSYRDVIIDQMAYFDLRMLELMIQSMPNLETIAISRCLLFDVTKLGPLIDIIKRHPEVLKNGEKQYIKPDFAPYFFDGPNDINRYGSYGVTHHEPNFHIPKAIMALLFQCMPKAKEIGMDLVSDSSSFWNFVRRLPGPDALWHIKARDAYVVRNKALAKMRPNMTNVAQYKAIPGSDNIEHVFADDITAAVTGDGVGEVWIPQAVKIRALGTRNQVLSGEGHWWREKRRCRVCHVELPESLFSLQRTRCWGCEMVEFVDQTEDSHFRYRMSGTISHLLDGLKVDEASFADILSPEREKHLELTTVIARDTDRAWAYHLLFETGNGAERAPYPEIPVIGDAQDFQAAIRRLRNCLHVCKAGDFRTGGPQYIHSGRVSSWARALESCVLPGEEVKGQYRRVLPDLPPGSEDFDIFKKRWQWTLNTENALRTTLQYDFRIMDHLGMGAQNPQLDTSDAFIDQLKLKPKQREFAMHFEWKMQCIFDKVCQMYAQGKTEDYMVAGIGPGYRPYSLDKHKEGIEWLGGEYMRNPRYMQDAE
ncbi:hypothetical protein B0T14DRAFT_491084 [Immersiella caudata]|uniref:Uncharacterized protein n=1 Tax=Immersiella caudata TaxID=314043 RepID=A0AA40CCV5_9PEZI|nr:hypothetical protein B0T14DRAFT_491084 [Immersiella caudata]